MSLSVIQQKTIWTCSKKDGPWGATSKVCDGLDVGSVYSKFFMDLIPGSHIDSLWLGN